jgi:Fe-S cluster assembly protein SufD
MNTVDYFKERFDQLQSANGNTALGTVRRDAFDRFSKMGIPTVKHEEWKYTRIGGLFNKEYQYAVNPLITLLSPADINSVRLPGHEQANELVFVNGVFSLPLSVIRSAELVVLPLEEAAKNAFKEIVSKHFGHSSNYLQDGINALNTALANGGIFLHIRRGQIAEHPVYIYNITDSRSGNILAQPRSLVHIGENAQVRIVETYATVGSGESFTNR